jgi:hypothetical protein
MRSQTPTDEALAAELGDAQQLWTRIVESISERFGPINQEWKPSKMTIGWMCLLQRKKRTLVYLTPEKEEIRAAIVLGEKAVALALASALPERIKALIREARPYAEGRGIRFPVRSVTDVRTLNKLITIKLTRQ